MLETWEVVFYADESAAITQFDRNRETGHLTYFGRQFLTADQAAALRASLHSFFVSPSINPLIRRD